MTRLIVTAFILSLTLSVLPASAAGEKATAATPAIAVSAQISQALARPALLPALYASAAALHAFDVYSTRQAMSSGAREVNPLMQGVVGNAHSFVAVKAAVAVVTIVVVERLWKTNRTAAILAMVASNSVAAIVAANNARTLRQLR